MHGVHGTSLMFRYLVSHFYVTREIPFSNLAILRKSAILLRPEQARILEIKEKLRRFEASGEPCRCAYKVRDIEQLQNTRTKVSDKKNTTVQQDK